MNANGWTREQVKSEIPLLVSFKHTVLDRTFERNFKEKEKASSQASCLLFSSQTLFGGLSFMISWQSTRQDIKKLLNPGWNRRHHHRHNMVAAIRLATTIMALNHQARSVRSI